MQTDGKQDGRAGAVYFIYTAGRWAGLLDKLNIEYNPRAFLKPAEHNYI